MNEETFDQEFSRLCKECDEIEYKLRGWRVIFYPFYARTWNKKLKRMEELVNQMLLEAMQR